MAERNDIGKEGETLACQYLVDHGYRIMDRNWHWHHYELDMVARKGNEIVFVEVKTRAAAYLDHPADALSLKQMRRLVAAADAYMRSRAVDLTPRFDLILVTGQKGDYEINHIEDAFYPPI